jgi:hypothetical protein
LEPFRILLIGSRLLEDRPLMVRALSDVSAIPEPGTPLVLRHGGAKGADTLADSVWRSWMGVWADCVYLEPEVCRTGRNPHAGVDLLLAFPQRTSLDVWDAIRTAEAAGIPWVNAVVTDNDPGRLIAWREAVLNDPRNQEKAA